jgi:hypothetical protein
MIQKTIAVTCIALVAAGGLFGAAGCGGEEPPEKTENEEPKGKTVTDEPVHEEDSRRGGGGYIDTLRSRGVREGRERPALIKLTNEIKKFEVLEGRYPKSLEELKKWRGGSLPTLPKGREYRYNPETGEIGAVNSDE